MLKSVIVLLAVVACGGCSQTLSVAPPTLTSGAAMTQGRRLPAASFTLADRVVMLVDITWPDPTADGGIHACTWRWYRDGQLVSQSQARLVFRSTPFTLRTARAAATLGVGRYTVQTLIDDQVVATSPFSIVG